MSLAYDVVNYTYGGTMELFVPDLFIVTLSHYTLASIQKVELIAPDKKSVTLVNLIDSTDAFTLQNNITSNANVALITSSSMFTIANNATIEAERIFITNYPIDQDQFVKTAEIVLGYESGDHLVINHGNIITRRDKGSAIATDHFVNDGHVVEHVDNKSYVGMKTGQLVPYDPYEFIDSDVAPSSGGGSYLGKVFNFIFGGDYGN